MSVSLPAPARPWLYAHRLSFVLAAMAVAIAALGVTVALLALRGPVLSAPAAPAHAAGVATLSAVDAGCQIARPGQAC